MEDNKNKQIEKLQAEIKNLENEEKKFREKYVEPILESEELNYWEKSREMNLCCRGNLNDYNTKIQILKTKIERLTSKGGKKRRTNKKKAKKNRRKTTKNK